MFNWIFETYGVQLMQAVLCAIGGGLGYMAWKLYNRYIDTAEKRSVAYTAAAFVEQVWRDIHGPDKLSKALEVAQVLLKKKGIVFDSTEMKILIEAAVGQFNDVFNRDAFNSTALNAGSDKTLDTGDEEAPVFEEELLLGEVPLFDEKSECTPNDT